MAYFTVIMIIGILILVHELGHFLAARAVGIPVEVFSVGFGPAIWKRRIGLTEYRLSLVPVGGYVIPAVCDERAFFLIPAWKRVVFSLGGPAANVLLAVAAFSAAGALSGNFTFSALAAEPVLRTVDIFAKIVGAIGGLFSRPDQVSGIVGIVHQGSAFVGSAPVAARFAALMSVNLAVFNLLPLPVLDGGKLVLYGLEKINSRLARVFVPASVAGWLFIIGLMVYATILDIGRMG